jgi:hypothetical protein
MGGVFKRPSVYSEAISWAITSGEKVSPKFGKQFLLVAGAKL